MHSSLRAHRDLTTANPREFYGEKTGIYHTVTESTIHNFGPLQESKRQFEYSLAFI